MTPGRWFAAVAIGCAAVAAVLLPYPRVSARSWAPLPPEPLAAALSRLGDAAAEVQSAVRTYRTTQALDRWSAARTASSTTNPVRLDRSVPSEIAAAVRSAVADQWTRLGPTASAAHAEVFIYLDSTTIPRAKNTTGSRVVIEPRRFIDIRFALPEATDGERCVTLVRLRGTTAAHVDALRSTSLTGVCAFFAVFGMPGSGVHRWLSPTNYAFARQSDWDVARAPSIDVTALYALSAPGSTCLTGGAGACVAVLGVMRPVGGSSQDAPSPRTAWVLEDVPKRTGGPAGGRVPALGDAEGRFLADAVRDLGPERFARFWQAGAPPDAAFSAAAGTSLEAWTHDWVTRTYGAVPERPTVRATYVYWLAAAFPVCLVVGARPRERVLAERVPRSRR